VPAAQVPKEPRVHGAEELSQDLEQRLDQDAVRYVLQVQGYVDPKTTPLDDARETWNTPWVTVGELMLPRQSRVERAAGKKQTDAEVDRLAYSIGNRWSDDPGSLKGVGDINAIREAAYQASAEGRGITGAAGKRCPFGFA
ncbi:MAG: catalase, partial [Cyanobacteria bacterium RYN_339]|nr:catalase [Cyanobacteria bacterium RYN_339]